MISPDVKFQDLKRPTTDLAKVAHPIAMRAANREDAMIVAVMRDGAVFFIGERLALEHLNFRIRERLALGSEKKVYINADARAKYGRVREVLEAIQSSGVERVGFLVDQRKQSSLP